MECEGEAFWVIVKTSRMHNCLISSLNLYFSATDFTPELLYAEFEQIFNTDKEDLNKSTDTFFFKLKQKLSISAISKIPQDADLEKIVLNVLVKLSEKKEFLRAFISDDKSVALVQLLSHTLQANEGWLLLFGPTQPDNRSYETRFFCLSFLLSVTQVFIHPIIRLS